MEHAQQQLMEKISELEQGHHIRIANMNSDVSKLQKELASSKSEIHILSQEREIALSKLQKLALDFKSLTTERERLEDETLALRDSNQALKRKLEEKEADQVQMEMEIQRLAEKEAFWKCQIEKEQKDREAEKLDLNASVDQLKVWEYHARRSTK